MHNCTSFVKSDYCFKMFPFLSQPQSKPCFRQQVGSGVNRRRFIVGLSASAAAATVLRGTLTPAYASNISLPNSPVTLNIIVVAGNLRLTQQSIEIYRKGNRLPRPSERARGDNLFISICHCLRQAWPLLSASLLCKLFPCSHPRCCWVRRPAPRA